MSDSYGDGWNNAVLRVEDCSGVFIFDATLRDGRDGSELHCLPSQYRVSVSAGAFPEEIQWQLGGMSGGAPFEGDTCSDNPPPCTETQLHMFDSYGDGWNGAEMIVRHCSGDIIFHATLDEGHNASDVYCLPSQFRVSVTSGSYPGEIQWQLGDMDG